MSNMDSVVITGGAIVIEKVFDLRKTSKFPIKKIEEINYSELIGSRGLKYLTEATKQSLAASIIAKEHAGLMEIPNERGGVILATNLASISYVTEFDLISLEEGVNNVSPMQGPNLLLNAPASRLGIHHKLSGYNTTITSGRVGALDALEFACQSILKGEVDISIVGGVEEKTQNYINWFVQAGLIDESESERINQGAGVVILESKEHAENRGATIYGEILNFSSYFDVQYLNNNRESNNLAENYKQLIEDVINSEDYEINSLCLSDNQLDRLSMNEQSFLENYFQNVEFIKHFDEFGGELNSCSGIVQLLSSLEKTKDGHGIIFNYDWFGNFRSLLFRKR